VELMGYSPSGMPVRERVNLAGDGGTYFRPFCSWGVPMFARIAVMRSIPPRLACFSLGNRPLVKQTPTIGRSQWKLGCVKMIVTATAVMGLVSAGIFVAHTVDAYREP
jgi:hypothetical protein